MAGPTDPGQGFAQGLVEELDAAGVLGDPAWRAAFEEVPRELFVPFFYAATSDGDHERFWRDDPDPRRRAGWREGVYADQPLATRIRDGELVSSSSQPSLMATMLEQLKVEDGMDVLEIGTGPGYNAALLSHRLGDAHVTTVDLDPGITAAARAHLEAAGHRPTVVTGDGARGCPGRAPYDRVIATCAVPEVPAAWVEQCVAGALVLAPLATGLLALWKSQDGRAQGHFTSTPAFFVPLRGGTARERHAAEPPRGVPREALRDDGLRFLLTLADGQLEPEEALTLWEAQGRPGRERYGVTVEGGRQWAWLDDPEGPHAWPLDGTGEALGGTAGGQGA